MILAGGTGGHVYPALAVARALKDQGHEVFWMGTRRGLEARVVPKEDIPMEWLSVEGIRGKSKLGLAKAPFMLLKALRQAWSALKTVRPDVVLGMGGFVSGPGGLVAGWMGIPLVLHEQNRIPGTTNRLLAQRADVVLEAFPRSFPASMGAVTTGNPLREGLNPQSRLGERLDRSLPCRLLIVGGSLGAKVLNETVPEAIAALGETIEVWHQTGLAMVEETTARYAALGLKARVSAFIDDMAAAYDWADMAICRSGAMTVSELAAVGLPAILIPYPHAIDDHQTANARYLSDAGGALLMRQAEMSVASLKDALKERLFSKELLSVMRINSQKMAQPEATQRVVAVCLEQAAARDSKKITLST